MRTAARLLWTDWPAQLALSLILLLATDVRPQVSSWQIGGDNGLDWTANDSVRVFIDFESLPGAIQPIYLTPEQTVFTHLDNWSPWKVPRELGYVDGERPRAWKNGVGDSRTVHNATYLIDGDSTTYNPPSSNLAVFNFYTIDLAVPVPAFLFGFFPPPRGFRSDGTPLKDDAVPAFQISIATEADPAWVEDNAYQRIGPFIADIAENLSPRVQIDFPRQYVRFVRWHRELSVLDPTFTQATNSQSGQARPGTIGDFELFAQGVPQRVFYVSKIIDLGEEVNFGRLFWSSTPVRIKDRVGVPAPEADVGMRVEVRTGRDDDPNVYHEFDDKGRQVIVSRQRYEYELKESQGYGYVASGRPGVRGEAAYDEENWTFWSPSFTVPGQPLNLRGGSHLQIKIRLESEDFDAFMRLDSLWIEKAPLLARRIVGEVARLDDPQPERGFTEVDLGEMTDFTYDIRADFEATERGFDALRIRTGGQIQLRTLEMGSPPTPVEPLRIDSEEGGLVILLPERVTADNNAPLRVVFAADVFVFATTFEGEVLDTAGKGLPQPVGSGDVTDAVSTNSLRVLVSEGERPHPIQDLRLSTPVLTPNGDGIHDQLEITYSLFLLPSSVPAELEVYSLDGRRRARLPLPLQASGPQRLTWDGRDAQGRLLPPGIYLIDVALRADTPGSHRLHPLAITY